MAAILTTPFEVALQIASRAKAKRLSMNLSQQGLSERAAVSLAAIKKFEHTGKIALESILKLALTLDSLGDFTRLFQQPAPETYATLDELLKQKTRQRGRQ